MGVQEFWERLLSRYSRGQPEDAAEVLGNAKRKEYRMEKVVYSFERIAWNELIG